MFSNVFGAYNWAEKSIPFSLRGLGELLSYGGEKRTLYKWNGERNRARALVEPPEDFVSMRTKRQRAVPRSIPSEL